MLQISEDSLSTFVGIFPNVPDFLEFKLEISFCISFSLTYLKLNRDSKRYAHLSSLYLDDLCIFQ